MKTELIQKIIPFNNERIEWEIDQSYSKTMRRIHSILKKPILFKLGFMLRFKQVEKFTAYINQNTGVLGLMILGSIPHGMMLSLSGERHRALQLFIGNPMIALSMMKIHPEAGVYAPLRLFIHEIDNGRTLITYDKPSRIFGQWNDQLFHDTGKLLDEKMETLIRFIDSPN
jgi:uncharacterized protein (DUF302 family)